MGASPVASGPPAARGAPERSGSLPVSREQPVWLAPLCLRQQPPPRPRYLTAPARFQTPDGRQGAGRGRSPGRWELRPGRPGQFERGAGCAERQVGCVLGANFGVPQLLCDGNHK